MIKEFGPLVRVEDGPVLRFVKADEAILSNKRTATHYQVGKPDALGRPIVIGQDMLYADWKGKDRQYNVYELDENDIWQKRGHYLSEWEAERAAQALQNKYPLIEDPHPPIEVGADVGASKESRKWPILLTMLLIAVLAILILMAVV